MEIGTKLRLEENLKTLSLSNMLKTLENQVRQAKAKGESYEEFLLSLTEMEIEERSEKRQVRRLQEAKFPLMKPLETFQMESAPNLDKRELGELSNSDYIREKKNVIFLGRSGTGKTHLAIGLGIKACKKNYRVRFITGYGLVNELTEARKESELSKLVQKYSKYDLLILDELGYIPFSKEGSELLFQVLAERHERGSVIITTNLGFGEWTELFRDQTMTAALLDRLTHKAHIITCNWESYRLKEALKEKEEGSRANQEKISSKRKK